MATKKKSGRAESGQGESRISVRKTHKHYIGGRFVRSESGRVFPVLDGDNQVVAQCCVATRKDFRDAVAVARGAQSGWASRSAFNRSQVLYRISEMLEDRRASLVDHLGRHGGLRETTATEEVNAAIDHVFWYAGWADKLPQVLGNTNPVSTSFFNFTLPEPVGVVAVLPSPSSPLAGVVAAILPVILTGNSCVALLDTAVPTIASDFAEVMATSDVPGGVVNLMTGKRTELLETVATHKGVHSVACFGPSSEERAILERGAAESVKRVACFDDFDAETYRGEVPRNLYWIEKFVEWKTTWHPVGT